MADEIKESRQNTGGQYQAPVENNEEPLIQNENSRKQNEIEDDNEVYDHQCALEHSRYFKERVSQSNQAIRKLVLVSIVCFFFCGTETAGGLLSGSLAILTDAAHQFSDVAGFVISFIAICCSKRKASMRYSYGYHRADVLGALATVIIIWGLLIWLIIEAIARIQNPTPINADIMLITSCVGFGCNILNLVILFCCCNETDEKGEKVFLVDTIKKELVSNRLRGSALRVISKKSATGRTVNSRRGSFMADLRNTLKLGGSQLESQNKFTGSIQEDPQDKGLIDTSKPHYVTIDDQMAPRQVNLASEFQKKTIANTITTGDQAPEAANMGSDVETNRNTYTDLYKGYEQEAEDAEEDEGQNLNIRAAIVHMAGDMVQSLGVIAAAVIIYINPDYAIADPICTFLFSILVLLTTVPIFCDCCRIMMEAAPEEIDTPKLFNALTGIDFVEEVHDFHVHALSADKPIMTCHVVLKERMDPKLALADLTAMVQHEFGIFHSTFQIEESKLFEGRQGAGKLQCFSH